MILYFTGTGNSEFAAEYIADHIGDECVSLNNIIKHRKAPVFHSEKPFVISAPVYAGMYPVIVTKLLRKAKFTGSKKIYFVATLGSKSCGAGYSLRNLARDKGLEFGGLFCISMPNNYIAGGNVPSDDDAEYKIKYTSIPLMESVSEIISAGETIPHTTGNAVSTVISEGVSSMFNKYMASSDAYTVSADCISCGKCAKVCPVNNIMMVGGEPLFRKKCIGCYACMSSCPKKAINIGQRSVNVNKYHCPKYKEWKEKGIV